LLREKATTKRPKTLAAKSNGSQKQLTAQEKTKNPHKKVSAPYARLSWYAAIARQLHEIPKRQQKEGESLIISVDPRFRPPEPELCMFFLLPVGEIDRGSKVARKKLQTQLGLA